MRVDQIDVDSRRYAYAEIGSGPLLLFGHGTFGGKELFTPQLNALSDRFRCVALDWLGHGESGWVRGGWTIDDLVADVPSIIEALGHESAVLAGVSQGGAVFTRVALGSPDIVDALVIMCAGPGAPPPDALARLQTVAAELTRTSDGPGPRRAAEFFARTLHRPEFEITDPDTFEQEVGIMLSHSLEALEYLPGVPASYGSIETVLPQLSVPTLVLWGRHDFRPTLGATMAAEIPGAQYLLIETAGHHVNVDAPAEVSEAIRAFLDVQPGPSY